MTGHFIWKTSLECSGKVLTYTHGMTLDEFRNNDLVFDAVVRNLEIIGEAAKHLPGEATAMMPDIEWSKAAAFRDVIAHHYFGLNVSVVWDVVQNKIPEIVQSAGTLLKSVQDKNN